MRRRDLEALGFPVVLEALAREAVSTLGADACRALRPLRERADAERALDRQWEFFRLTEIAGPAPLTSFPDVRESLALAEHDGATLAGERLVEIRTVLRQAHLLLQYLRRRAADAPALADLSPRLHPLPELEATLARMLDDTGELRDDASPTLVELRSRLRALRQQIEERLDRLVASTASTSMIADRYVTVRNNRFVVPVKAEASGMFSGVVQDRSASGETLFMEPLFAIELNNSLLLLRKEEEIESLRLLGLLTAQVGAVRHEIADTLAALAELDRLAAGAAFARRFRCTRPLFAPAGADARMPTVELRAARHPELLLTGRSVTPIDVRIGAEHRALVVSGPNTGGKTVALKTLGLLTVCAHAGLLLPVDEGSVVPFVAAVFTDLADDQSIERDLSTFSSHIVNLVEIFRELAPPALVLLDEPGGGTDPDEGAALAVALLDRLIDTGVWVAAATHYAAVKLYALNDSRIELAAVEADPRTFAPRYHLQYGSVGESLGLAVARRLHLPASLLAAAEARRGESSRQLADAIQRLEGSRRRFDDERAALVEERHALATIEREHAALVAELRERRRARWSTDLEDARTFLRDLKQEGRELLEVIRRRPPDAARALADFAGAKAAEIDRRAGELREPEAARPPVKGDHVEIAGTTMRGELVEVSGDSARVRRGGMTIQVPLERLRCVATAPGATSPTVARRPDAPAALEEVHLIGLRTQEALSKLDQSLDRAQAAGAASVRIVHGIGTGALKRAIAEYLRASPYCARFHQAEPRQGGAGVTIAELA